MYNYVDPREIKAHMLIVDDDQQNAEIAAAFSETGTLTSPMPSRQIERLS